MRHFGIAKTLAIL
jgi:hypothetical protein